ncbi:phage terminase large subunit GpA-like protein [Ancylobacter sp. 3268]|uniref:phage terminase large subunit family protein n=1 Tax=Ancylobacter sp. 3268 TaxID=2817752 RepID=UPI00285424EE|nr:terminase gpA endonuclease subunit [Ancylobacter sp. 3268]MDR6952304.1 phage terminase large subunit GpA-like protein [Ancylobacter sp. 3268]
MDLHVANAEHLAATTLATVLEPPPPVDFLAWAENNIVFSDVESEFAGPYNRALFGYFDEILRALGPDDPCRIVTLAKSAQLGGTVLANVFVGGALDMDPGNVLYVHPTTDNAARWSRLKLSPFIKGTASLAALFNSKSRDGADAVLYKERKDGRGSLLISGANSAASLSQVSMPRQVQDDLVKWEMNTAGDPEVQADSRSRGYEFAKIFKVSTPKVMPGCRITRNFEAGSQERPFVPCPHCGVMQVLEWDNMLAHLDETKPEAAHFVCVDPDCAKPIEEHHRRWMVSQIEWRAANPSARREHRSFWIWSAYSPLQSWERIAREWLKARGDAATEQTFTNDSVGLAYRAAGESVPWEEIRDRAAGSDYSKGQIPLGALLVTVGVDCQTDRVEWQAVGWGRDRRRWVIDAGVIRGHITDATCQQTLDALLGQKWRNALGRMIGVDLLAIDGNAWTEDVWAWARRHPDTRVIMVRGRHEDHVPLLERVRKERRRDGTLLRYSRRFYNFGTSILKMALYRNLAKTDPLQRGYIGMPRGLDDEYFRQLTAERRKPVKRRDGYVKYQWVPDPGQANEMLDTHLQAEAAAIRLGCRDLPEPVWEQLENERETAPPEEQASLFDVVPVTAAPPPIEVAASAAAGPEPAPASNFARPHGGGSWMQR